MIGILSFGQKFQILSGNKDFLKDQKEINVELKFDEAKFNVENYTETEYLGNKQKDFIENPKRGESYWKEWISSWNEHKNSTYLEKFIKGTTKSKNLKFDKNPSAKYTLIIEPDWIYIGFHAGIVFEPAKITSTLKFVETANPSNVLLTIQSKNVKGTAGQNDFVMEVGRISSAFEKTGQFLVKELK